MEIEYLDPSNAKLYRPCLAKTYMQDVLNGCENVVAIGAKASDLPCGCVFAKVLDKIVSIKNLFVLPFARRKGAASLLINELKSKAKELGCGQIKFNAVTSKNNIDLLNKFLTTQGFPKIELLARIYKASPEWILKEGKWAKRLLNSNFELPDKVIILNKDEVDAKLLAKLKNKEDINYPDVLSPFKNEFDLQREFSLFAVFDNKKIVGWFTALRTNDDRILYRSVFVDDKYRKSKLGLIMFSKVIKYHVKNCMDKEILAAAAVNNISAVNFYSSFFNNFCDSIKYEFSTNIEL